MEPNTSISQIGEHRIYRREALEHFLRKTEGKDILKVTPPWTWILLWIFGTCTLTAFLFSVFGRVEINVPGKGILRPTHGVRVLNAQSGGIVAEVLAPSGTHVQAGQPLLRINAPQIQGALLEAQTDFQTRTENYQPVLRSQEALFAHQRATLELKVAQTKTDLERYRASLRRAAALLEAMNKVRSVGIYSVTDYNREEENKSNAERQVANTEYALKQVRQELANLQTQRNTQVWQNRSELANVTARLQSAGLTQEQTVVVAPVAGVVDGLVLRPGDSVQTGQIVAKVVPKESPLMAVAFLLEKDRGFVQPGDRVRLELNQFPFSEFGTLDGRIRAIAADLSSPEELKEAFGASQPEKIESAYFRVEIDILPDKVARKPISRVPLRPGMLLYTRFTLRRQSLITFAIDPLKRWLN